MLKETSHITLFSTKAAYIALTLTAKEAFWLRVLLTKIEFLEADKQHAQIIISSKNTCM